MEPIAIKAFYGEEVRRFSVDSITGFAEMMHELKTRFGMNEDQKVALKFKDDEDEKMEDHHPEKEDTYDKERDLMDAPWRKKTPGSTAAV